MDGWNYFNYFTEIEEYFWKKRGAHLLVSPLDWAIMETWQKAGVPLEAALKGIDRAFESYGRSRRGGGRPLKSLAYCTDAVLEAAEEAQEAAAGRAPAGPPASREPFSRAELRAYLETNALRLLAAARKHDASSPQLAERLGETSRAVQSCLAQVDSPAALDLEELERRLSVLEEKAEAALLVYSGEEVLLRIRREMDAQLREYRRKMKAEQIALVEKQLLRKRLFEEHGVPRLSLFYCSL